MSRMGALLRLTGLAILIAVIGACAGQPEMDIAADASCPELTGSYCAFGQKWEKGQTRLEPAFLPNHLGIERQEGWPDVDRVDFEGASNGTLTITLLNAGTEVDKAVISQPAMVCGNDRTAIRMDTVPWGGAGLVLAFGASAGWSLLQRHQDGSLRIEQQRNETGTLFLVIPLHFSNDSALRFGPYEAGECTG